MIRQYIPKSVEELSDWYMRYISPLALIAGVVADNLVLLRRVDLWTSNLLLFTYLFVAAGCIFLFNLIESGRLRHPWVLKVFPLLPVVAQFAFGGLFSGYVSLYSRSAQFAWSWIFVTLLIVVLIGNERLYRHYRNFTVQIGAYFFVLFSFLIFFLPVIFREIGPWMFVVSGLLSLGTITLLLYALSLVVPEIVRRDKTRVARVIAVMYVLFNIAYFTNVIPPLPLSIKDAGVYHTVERAGDEYKLTYEPLPWYKFYLRYNTTYHRAPGEPVYVWTAIFAPTGLKTTIYHEWQWYNEESGKWVDAGTFSYPILGGRDGGFRGYTMKRVVSVGEWRVNVVTGYGQIIGRVKFTVADAPVAPELVERTQ